MVYTCLLYTSFVKEYGTKALICYGGDYLKKNGLLDRIENSLTESGISFLEFDGVVPLSLIHI